MLEYAADLFGRDAIVDKSHGTSRCPTRHEVAEKIDRLFEIALTQAHDAREALEKIDVLYEHEPRGPDDGTDPDPLGCLFPEAQQRDELQWCFNVRALSRKSFAKCISVMRWLECAQSDAYASMECATAKDERVSAAETRRRRREAERQSKRADWAFERARQTVEALLTRDDGSKM
ncbi:MAG TPA: hypothetical protein VFU90_16210, partial [Candidatus Tumulicola sp.]|nr:hypothetical protein [Candidatus Tumulicola sp.]